MTKPTLLVLAAGMGSRYGGLKQIDPVGPDGEAILDYSVYDALRAGFGKLVFVIRREFEEKFRQTFGQRFGSRVPVDYVSQELEKLPRGFSVPANRAKPWGTGHAVLTAADVIRGPFAAINADDFYGANSFRVLAEHLRGSHLDYAMVGFVLRNTLSEFGSVARGVCQTGPDGYLEAIRELSGVEQNGDKARYTDQAGSVHQLSGEEPVSMNMWGFAPALFDQLREQFGKFLEQHKQDATAEFYISTAVNKLIAKRAARCRVLRTPDRWLGVTYREDKPRVIEGIRALIERGDYPERLWK